MVIAEVKRIGLSPRVRGNPRIRQTGFLITRSIPACAGEPGAAVGRRWNGAVYPRVCGGTSVPSKCLTSVVGLSPRVRGNRHLSGRPAWANRSIPACAGEPNRLKPDAAKGEVYPRVCGGARCG